MSSPSWNPANINKNTLAPKFSEPGQEGSASPAGSKPRETRGDKSRRGASTTSWELEKGGTWDSWVSQSRLQSPVVKGVQMKTRTNLRGPQNSRKTQYLEVLGDKAKWHAPFPQLSTQPIQTEMQGLDGRDQSVTCNVESWTGSWSRRKPLEKLMKFRWGPWIGSLRCTVKLLPDVRTHRVGDSRGSRATGIEGPQHALRSFQNVNVSKS